MNHDLAQLTVRALAGYAAIGLAFAPFFVFIRASRIDPDARVGSLPFRLLILPGAAALWPLLALDWLRGFKTVRAERNAHRNAVSSESSEETS